MDSLWGACRPLRPNSPYYDPKSMAELPRWQTVEVEFVEAFSNLISLETLKLEFGEEEIWVVKRGNRLSVMPVEEAVARKILGMAGAG